MRFARSTMTTLLKRRAEILAPMSRPLMEKLAACEIVQAGETDQANCHGYYFSSVSN